MNRDIFEQEIEHIIDKYSDLESIAEMLGDDSLDNIKETTFNNLKDENIESEFLYVLNNKISNPKENNIERTLLKRYFDEVGYIYEQNNNETEIEFCEENRNKIIEMNLKCVVKIAKRYRGLGVDFEDLISAGNEGLCIAFDKYKPNKKKLRENLLSALEYEDNDISNEWVEENIKPYCKYGKTKNSFQKTFTKHSYPKDLVKKWIKTNIKDASFNSVAMMWAQAWIRAEISNNSRLIKKPVNEIKKEKDDSSLKYVFLNVDGPKTSNSKVTTPLIDTLVFEEEQTNIESNDAYNTLYNNIEKMFDGLEVRHKRIVMQRFGIGLPRAMTPVEIAERENISKARISQIIKYSLEVMRKNSEKYNIDYKMLFEMVRKYKAIF